MGNSENLALRGVEKRCLKGIESEKLTIWEYPNAHRQSEPRIQICFNHTRVQCMYASTVNGVSNISHHYISRNVCTNPKQHQRLHHQKQLQMYSNIKIIFITMDNDINIDNYI